MTNSTKERKHTFYANNCNGEARPKKKKKKRERGLLLTHEPHAKKGALQEQKNMGEMH